MDIVYLTKGTTINFLPMSKRSIYINLEVNVQHILKKKIITCTYKLKYNYNLYTNFDLDESTPL